MSFTPILPKNPKFMGGSKATSLENRMRGLMVDLQRTASNYEPPPSPNYQRTGNLARSWSRWTGWEGNDLVGIVVSDRLKGVIPYNIYVRGIKMLQAAHMAARGWLSVEDIMPKFWPKALKDFIAIIKRRT
jgi:hypothetical protein